MRTKSVWVVGAVLPCLAIFLCAGPSLAAEVSPPAAAVVNPAKQRSGTFEVTAKLHVGASLPDGTQITASANAQVSDTIFFGNISLQGESAVSAGKVTFKFLLPYAWKVASAADKVIVQLTVQGSASGAAAEYTDQAFLSQTIPLPKNGATTPVIFTGSL